MAEDVVVMQEKTSNACCAALAKKHSKLLEKYSKLEELKNKFRNCTALIQDKYDVIEKENGVLKKALEELKVQANIWKDEKDKESGRRVDLEDEVSALKEEVQLLKQAQISASQGADKEIQQRLNAAEKEIKHLNEVLDKERERAALEKKNAELEKKKADEALKKVEVGIKKVSESQKVANVEKKKAEESRLLWEKLKTETDAVKSILASERSKVEAADKKVEAEKQKVIKERKRADLAEAKSEEQRKRADLAEAKPEEQRKRADLAEAKSVEQRKRADLAEAKSVEQRKRADLAEAKSEEQRERADLAEAKSEEQKKKADLAEAKCEEQRKRADLAEAKSEEQRKRADLAEAKSVEQRKRADLAEAKSKEQRRRADLAEAKSEEQRKRADLAEVKSEEQRKLAETNLKKAMLEKDRADDLGRKLEETRIRAEKLEELHKRLCSEKIVEAQADESKIGKGAQLSSDACVGVLKNDAQLSKWVEKILSEKEQYISREKKRADSEKKKAKKQKKVAEAHRMLAMKQKNRADQLSEDLESYKLRLEELQKELQELVSHRIHADNAPLRNNEVTSETGTVKLLKKRLKLEKMLVKQANETAKVEALRTNMLHRELFHLKQECCWFQQRLDFLDSSFLHGLEGTHHLEKIGNQTSPRKTLRSDVYSRPLVSGIDSRLDPPYRGSNQKMLQSSAINSSSASFSDRTLMGSQERRTSSVTTSDKLGEDISNLKPTMSRLYDKRRMRYNGDAVAKADSSMRSPIKDNDNGKRIDYSGRKRILDALESIENSYSVGEKLHQRVLQKLSLLRGVLDDRKDEHENILKENTSRKMVNLSKRRRTSPEEGIHCLQETREPKSIDSGVDHPDACARASPREVDVMKPGWHFKDVSDDKFGNNHRLPLDFDEMTTFDYMKLLDLDNAADESSYRRAIALPLSPVLPEVEIHGDEKLEVVNPGMLAYTSSQGGLSDVRDNPAPISSVSIIDMEKNPTSSVINGLVSPRLQHMEDSVALLKSTCPVLSIDSLVNQIHVTDGKLGLPDLFVSANKETNIPCERGVASTGGCVLRYFVVSSKHKDSSSILRLLQIMNSCIPQCSFFHSTVIFLRSILHAISKAEDLSMKEKVCVFFSLVLHGVSEVRVENLTDSLNDKVIQSFVSVTQQIRSALSDPVFRRIFTESCDLFELLAVIESFILQQKVFVCGEVSDEPESAHSSKINLVLNGNATMVSEVVASSQLLIAGASMLASLCTAVDHVGFVCEMSCNIITMQKFDCLVVLAILHAFAHICGSKYFTLQRYSIAMAVVKSLVVFLEKQILSTNSTSLWASMPENQSKIWLCSSNCPFSEGALSMEDVASLLLENLQKYSQSRFGLQDLLVPRVWSHEGRTDEASGSKEAELLSFTSDENLYDFTDILSLVEIVASLMSWEWTFDHIICQICEDLQSHLMEGSSAAIFVLLGQLGRLGVGAGGYEDARVRKLRGRLSAFVCESTFRKLNLSVQFAVIASLLRLTSIKFDEILEGKVGNNPAATGQSIPVSFIRDWFFRLSYEQQSLFRLHQAENGGDHDFDVSPQANTS